MIQWDIYWYAFRPPDKRRPVLILTRTRAISFLTNVTVALITTTIRGIPSEVVLTPQEDGVQSDCAVNADNIQTIQKSKLGSYVTTISPERMLEVRSAVEFAFGFDVMP